jgi:hypothetical protein
LVIKGYTETDSQKYTSKHPLALALDAVIRYIDYDPGMMGNGKPPIPSPSGRGIRAKSLHVGTLKKGVDGKMWVVVQRTCKGVPYNSWCKPTVKGTLK